MTISEYMKGLWEIDTEQEAVMPVLVIFLHPSADQSLPYFISLWTLKAAFRQRAEAQIHKCCRFSDFHELTSIFQLFWNSSIISRRIYPFRPGKLTAAD